MTAVTDAPTLILPVAIPEFVLPTTRLFPVMLVNVAWARFRVLAPARLIVVAALVGRIVTVPLLLLAVTEPVTLTLLP